MLALIQPRTALLCTLLTCYLALGGCSEDVAEVERPTPSATVDKQAHPSKGPHDGALIELGNEEYHAELVREEDGVVTVYILDSTARQTVPIDAAEVTVNLVNDGQAEQFALEASPEAADPSGQSSKFTSSSAELADGLDRDHVEAQLVATIGGKQYRGAMGHDHEGHEGHEG